MAKHPIRSALLSAGVLALAACGNDRGNDQPPAPQPIPPSDSFGLTSANRLIGFNLAAPGTTNVSLALSGLAAGEAVLGVAYRPADGQLYALIKGAASARVAVVNTDTGALGASVTLSNDAANANAFTTLSGTRFGLDFNPVPDRLRVISDSGQNLRINVATGAVLVDGALNGAATSASGAAYTNAFAAACRTALYVIDPASDRVYLQNPPNNGTLSSVGALGLDITAVGGFDVATDAATGANAAYAALTSAGGTALYRIDLATGAASAVQALTLNSGESLLGFATRPVAASATVTQAAGELIGLTTAGGLVSFQRGSPAKLCTSPAVSGLPAGSSLLGIATRPSTGGLVGLGSNNTLYAVGTDGAATALCTLLADPADTSAPFTGLDTAATTRYGIGFNPVPDRLRVVTNTGTNLRINPNPNAGGLCLVTTDTNLSGSSTPSVSAVGYTNTIPSAGSTTLYGLDTGSDALIRIGNDPANGIAGDPGNPNSGVVTPIGSLGVSGDVAANAGFLIDGRLNTAFAALQAGTATQSTLYSVNLGTGTATAVGTVGPAGTAPLLGLALTGGTTLKVYALSFDGHLLSFGQTGNLLTPNTVTDLTITGIAAGENLVGLDLRPSNGQLYALSTLGRVYTLNTTTGLATLASTLVADAADTTAPFSALSAGATYGLDFNPVPDRLRVVDSSGNNLRVNVTTGATTTDAPLSGNAEPIWAAAYANNFAGATSTTLYDLSGSTLYVQGSPGGTPNSPNGGVLTAVGSLGVTGLNDVGFDISGGANGLVLAAIRTAAGSGPSDLYRVNLATGAATPISATAGAATIGSSSTQQIRSLAIELR